MQTCARLCISRGWRGSIVPYLSALLRCFWRENTQKMHGLLWFSRSWGHIPCTSVLNMCVLQNLGSSLGPSLLWILCVCELLKWLWKAFKVCRCDLGVLLLINLRACSWKATVDNETLVLWLLLLKHSSKLSSLSILRKIVVKKLHEDGIKLFQVSVTDVIVSII